MLKNLILCWLILVPFSVLAQVSGESNLLKELEKEDQKYKQSQTFQGEPKSQEQIRKDAAENVKLNIVACPPNSNASKIEDIRNYIEQQEKLQVKFSASMEKFFKKGINKNAAINEFNAINNESNALIIWG